MKRLLVTLALLPSAALAGPATFPLPPQPPLPAWVTSAPKAAVPTGMSSAPQATTYFYGRGDGSWYALSYGATQSREDTYVGNPCVYGSNQIGETWQRCSYAGGIVVTNFQSPTGKCGVNGAQCDPNIP